MIGMWKSGRGNCKVKIHLMQRKKFIKLSSALMAAPFIPSVPEILQQDKLKNWSGNLTYSTSNVFYPKTVSELQTLIKKTDHLRGLGTRHCFNTIADSKYNLISSNKLNNILSLDAANKTLTVEGGIKYGELSPWLDKKGF